MIDDMKAPTVSGYLSIRAASERLGITLHAMRLRVRRRLIPATRIDWCVFLKESDVERMATHPPVHGWMHARAAKVRKHALAKATTATAAK